MKFSTVAAIAFCLCCLAGCKKEEPNPELLDPIFADLDKRATEAQKGLDEQIKAKEEAAKAIEKLEPNTIELKNARRDYQKAEHLIVELQQKHLYYSIRAKRRAIVDKITYLEAFSHDKPWPDPAEYSAYQVNMRLNEVNLNWNKRVPKLQSRLEKSSAAKPTPKEAEAKAAAEPE